MTASNDETARVWEARTGKLLFILRGHEGSVNSADFSPDGQRIITGSEDKTARIWTILPPSAGAPPDWIPDFFLYMAQRRLNSEGEVKVIAPNEWLTIRERLRAIARDTSAPETPYLRILRHFVHD